MKKTVDQIICDIIAFGMDLDSKHIWVRDQNVVIPPDEGLFIICGVVNAPVVMSVGSAITTVQQTRATIGQNIEQTVEVQTVQMREQVQIDIMSRNNDALARHWEVLLALGSIYAQQQQEKYVFKIFPRGNSFVNTSDAEGGSQLKRYTITIPVFTWYKKDKILLPNTDSYYDNFTTRVDDEKTIGNEDGLFEFEITPDTAEPYNV